MKISAICMQCSTQNTSNYIRIEDYIKIKENDLYHFKCSNGHNNLFEIQAFKFELLFESALCAIRDQYYLESVLSLTASLERFYEFFIRTIIKANGINQVEYDKLFKNISRQSERQFGAFLAIYSNHFKEAPPKIINQKQTEFRNKVVHKGFFPEKEQVLKYAEEIFDIIKFYYSKLLDNHNEEVFDIIHEIQLKRRKNNKSLINELKVQISNQGIILAIGHNSDIKNKNFNDIYNNILKSKLYK